MNKEKPRVITGIGEKKSNNGTQWYQQDRIYDNNIAITITTDTPPYYVAGGAGIMNKECVGTYQFSKSDNFMKGRDRFQEGKNTSDTLQTNPKEAIVNGELKVRRLTPRECGRLMGVKDEDIDKILKNQSDSSAYHLFGDSIVVNVLMAIFMEMIK